MSRFKAKLRTVYLFPDGHAVGVFEDRHARSGAKVEWVEVFEKFFNGNVSANVPDEDRDNYRLVLSGGLPGLVRKATHLDLWEDNSSEASKAKGMKIRTLTVYLKDGNFSVHEIDALILGDFHYQGRSTVPDLKVETFAESAKLSSWGYDRLNVTRVQRVVKATDSVV